MLTRLHVRNYVLIDSLEIDFPEGLVIITGQTGAGKSILLGAMSLLMGAKADVSMLSEGADNCVVEAEFEGCPLAAKPLFEDNELEWDDGRLIIRRVVNRSGRSRSFVNDSPVPVNVLQEISSYLIDIHSQHQTLLLSDRHFQLDILDHYAGNASLRGECALLWRSLGQKKAELSDLKQRMAKINADREYNEAQYRQLEAASLRADELPELEDEQKRLANAEEIGNCLGAVKELFTPSTDALSLDFLLKESARQLSKAGKYLAEAQELSQRVDSCRRELDDVLAEVESACGRVELAPDRLAQVEDRMSLLYGLMQRHGCTDLDELIAVRDRLSNDLYDSSMLEDKLHALESEIDGLENEYECMAKRLRESREKASEGFSAEMTAAVRGLELPYAVFETQLTDSAASATGRDTVTFLFSASGRNPVDLAKCASGGELSRIMLTLKAMRARYTSMPTMIFDEIDTGVSGSVADKMGSMICDMGQYMQVFAITHLPQVAAKGSAHYLVSKDIDPSSTRTISKIERLSDSGRVLEIARMLSGSVLTDAAVANAESLLNQ